MTLMIPIELLDSECTRCPQFKPYIESTPIFDDNKIVINYVVKARCVNLPLCHEGRLEGKVQ